MGKTVYFSGKELEALSVVLGTYLNVAGVDYGVDEECRSIEPHFDNIHNKIIKALKGEE